MTKARRQQNTAGQEAAALRQPGSASRLQGEQRQARAYIGIGSNIQPQEHIRQCLALLAKLPHSQPSGESPWYLTRPWGIEQQPNFINLVVRLNTGLSAPALLCATQAIEQRLQRVRDIKNGPRTIDLDILLFDDAVIETPNLIIPHPALLQRDFMLLPLLDIAPKQLHPLEGRRLCDLSDRIQYHQIIEQLPQP